MKPQVLVACEESQAVTVALAEEGITAVSADLYPTSGSLPEQHYTGDLFEAYELYRDTISTVIAFPPCTYLTVSGARWMYHPEDEGKPVQERRPHPKFPHRRQQQQEAVEFVRAIWNLPVPRVCIENPVGRLSTLWRRPSQIIQPWQFGHEATKTTCLWLRALPPLQPTNIVGKGERITFKSGKTHPAWYSQYSNLTAEERRKMRSKTFSGIASAMAQQWKPYINADNG